MASIVGGLAVRVVSAVSAVGSFYTEINPATLSGALDIVVVVQQDGSLACSPFHVRFGKLKILRPSEKLVELRIDNEKVSIDMKMGDAGECFFVVKTDANVPQEFKTSPIQKPQIINQVDAFLLDEDIINIKQDVKQENTQNSTIETQYTPTLTHLSTSNQIQLGTSPPGYISWSWGAFPEKQNKPDKDSQHGSERHRDSSENRQNISQFISTPALKLAYEKGAMSSNEKVDNYLNGLEEGLSETHIEVFDQSISTEMSVQRDQSVLTDQSNTSILSIQTDQSTNTVMIQADQSINTVLSVHPARSITTIMSTQADQTSLHDQALPISTQTQYPVEISICGPLNEITLMKPHEADVHFKRFQVDYERFCDDPLLLMDPLTVYKLDGFYHSWTTAAPCILSHIAFGRPINESGLNMVIDQSSPQVPVSGGYSFIRGWWGGRSSSNTPTNHINRSTSPQRNLNSSLLKSPQVIPIRGTSPVIGSKDLQSHTASPNLGNSSIQFAKSLRMTSDQLKSLNLKKGVNHITFTVTSALQGSQTCSAKIFFWDYNTKIVISDVDGTITKSDVLGHVGQDWTHLGVANLYTNIHKNGYQFLYLSSRAIGQAHTTREYLAKVEQDRIQLPIGPLLLSPDRLIQAFTREIILRKPEEFKIACLRDIKRLFNTPNGQPPLESPFFAGFGNRITDALSYRSVDVPSSRIFTVDSKGELKLELIANFKSSYIQLNNQVDQIFPPVIEQKTGMGEYSDFQFWSSPLGKVDVLDEVVVKKGEVIGNVTEKPLRTSDHFKDAMARVKGVPF